MRASSSDGYAFHDVRCVTLARELLSYAAKLADGLGHDLLSPPKRVDCWCQEVYDWGWGEDSWQLLILQAQVVSGDPFDAREARAKQGVEFSPTEASVGSTLISETTSQSCPAVMDVPAQLLGKGHPSRANVAEHAMTIWDPDVQQAPWPEYTVNLGQGQERISNMLQHVIAEGEVETGVVKGHRLNWTLAVTNLTIILEPLVEAYVDRDKRANAVAEGVDFHSVAASNDQKAALVQG
jgi:hypothetical protein